MKRLSILALVTLPCLPQSLLNAASVFRCSDAEGNVSFNQHGCPPDSQVEYQRTRTLNLLNSEPIPEENGSRYFPSQNWESPERSTEIVVVGERAEVCGNLISPQERRKAIIRKQVRKGMTRADVESALGKPDRISGTNGQVRYHYKAKQGAGQQVAFDEDGCVKSGR
ncbi:outer membrane protein assembly factor BamE [Metapseudomonas lalkuanensis]|uniref:outer membrane protein assembly factor BamE domain-containing protein n=1 Tax=Metapseudomonas lalkuanensis TaxID=2604832 RepID=UPI001CF1B1AA|nr:outer membrane protein assembly factor BamE [Pseudomonas lalkuanensis]UCO96895.1 outer membrane protein assembly factor BamE [Pseudomonas lalkuanensis]